MCGRCKQFLHADIMTFESKEDGRQANRQVGKLLGWILFA